MSDVWDSAVDDYLSGFGRPTPPGSPERMAKSMQLGSQTGVAPSIISLDPETWQSRLLDAKNAELLRKSAPLQSYVAKNPDYKEVSKDDFENLNQVADQTRLLYKPLPDPGFGGTLETVAPQGAVLPEAQKNFGTSLLRIWNDAYKAMHAEEGLGIKPGGEFETQFREAFPPGPGRTLIESIMYPSAAALDLLFQRYPAAIIAGAGAGVAEAGGAAGLPQPELLGRDISAMLEWLAMRSDFLAEKPGNFETLARKDIAQLDAVIRSIKRTNTKERAPQAMFDFVKPLAEDQTISIPGDVVSRLYEEKGIAPGSAEDTLFPFVPDISEQLARIEAAGGDVHISASSFLTHVKPEVFDEILQDVRVLDRPTINEAKEIDEAAAKFVEDLKAGFKPVEQARPVEAEVAKSIEGEVLQPGAPSTTEFLQQQRDMYEKAVQAIQDSPTAEIGELRPKLLELGLGETEQGPLIRDVRAGKLDEAAALIDKLVGIRAERVELERRIITEPDVVAREVEAAEAKRVEAKAATPVDLTVHEVPLPEGSPPREAIGQADIPAVRYGSDVWVGQADHLQLLQAIGSERRVPIEKLDEAKLDFGTIVDGKFKSYGDTTANVSPEWQRRAAEFVNKVADEVGTQAAKPVASTKPLEEIPDEIERPVELEAQRVKLAEEYYRRAGNIQTDEEYAQLAESDPAFKEVATQLVKTNNEIAKAAQDNTFQILNNTLGPDYAAVRQAFPREAAFGVQQYDYRIDIIRKSDGALIRRANPIIDSPRSIIEKIIPESAFETAARAAAETVEPVPEGVESLQARRVGEFLESVKPLDELTRRETSEVIQFPTGIDTKPRFEAIQPTLPETEAVAPTVPVAGEPPISDGYVRLYRGETTDPTAAPVPEWVRETPEFKGTVEATGRWFSASKAEAEYYIEKFGVPDAKVTYVDIPADMVEQFRVSNRPEVAAFSAAGKAQDEFFIPVDLADKRQPLETPLAREVPPATLEGERVFRQAIPVPVRELPGLKEAMRESISKGPATTPSAGAGLEGELTSARKALFLDTLFHDAKAAGMTEPELAAYSKRLKQVRDEEIERRKAAFERQERQRVRKATAQERKRGEEYYDNRRDVQAEQLLRSAGVKLDEKLVKPETVRKGLTSKDGVNPDDIAETMGYGSGEELLRDLEGLHAERAGQPPREAREFAISKFVEEAKIEPVRTDLTDAMFSEPMSKLLFDDLRVMSRQRGGTEFEDPLMFEELAARADRLYSEMPLSEAADFKSFARDVQKLGREAELALVKGDIEKAFKFKNQQLLAHMMAREARRFEREFARPLRASLREPRVRTPEEEAQAAVAAALAPEVSVPRRLSPSLLLERYQKKTPPKTVDPAYTDQIHAILTQHGIPIRRDIAELASVVQQDLRSFVASENALGADIQISDRLYESRFNKNPRDMTVQEHRELFESLQSLDYNGRMKEKLRKQGELEDREAVVKQIEDNLAQLPIRDKGKKRDPARTLQGARYGWDAWLLRPEELMDDLDLRDPQGPMNSYVFRPLQDSKHMEEGLTREASVRLRRLPKIKGAKKLVADVPFLNETTAGEGKQPYPYRLNKLDVVMMAAQLGNETSAERLIMTLFQRDFNDAMPAGAKAALIAERRKLVQDWVESKLTPEDFKFVEGMWDFFAWLKPKVDEVTLRTSGVRPDTVRATPWNDHKGGYFPIILDPAWSRRTPKEDVLFGPDYHAAATPKGYTKARTEMFNPVVVANQQYLLPGRIREMLHDISFRESLTQAWRIVNEPRVRSAINKHYGVEYTETLKPWLREIAYSFNQDDMSQKQLSQLLRGLRKNAVIATLGANLKVIMTPNAGPLLKYLAQSIVGHGGRTVPGLSQVRLSRMLLHPKHMWNFAMENSQEMRHRIENYDRDIRDSLGSMMNIQSKREWLHANAARAGMYMASRIDTALAAVAWNEEYARVYQTGKSYFSADEKVFDHDAAVYAADKLVRKFFGSHSPVDIPAAMRGSEIQKTFLTPFYGFQSAMYQRQRDVVQATRSGIRRWKKGDKTGARADFASALGQTWMFVLLSAALGAVYAPDLVDEEDWGGTAVKLLAGQLVSTIPFLRDVGQLALTETEGRPAPVMTGFVNVKKVVKDISDFLEDEGDFSQQRFVKHALATAGYVLGIPTVQPARTTEFLWNWTTGEDDAETFDEWFRGIVYGKSGAEK